LDRWRRENELSRTVKTEERVQTFVIGRKCKKIISGKIK
jgi:hypothetical protein